MSADTMVKGSLFLSQNCSGVKGSTSETRKVLLTAITKAHQAGILFLQEVSSAKSIYAILPDPSRYEVFTSGTEAALAISEDQFAVCQDAKYRIDNKSTTVTRLLEQLQREDLRQQLDTGRMCLKVIRPVCCQKNDPMLVVSWHGKHRIKKDEKCTQFRTLLIFLWKLSGKLGIDKIILGGDFNLDGNDASEELRSNRELTSLFSLHEYTVEHVARETVIDFFVTTRNINFDSVMCHVFPRDVVKKVEKQKLVPEQILDHNPVTARWHCTCENISQSESQRITTLSAIMQNRPTAAIPQPGFVSRRLAGSRKHSAHAWHEGRVQKHRSVTNCKQPPVAGKQQLGDKDGGQNFSGISLSHANVCNVLESDYLSECKGRQTPSSCLGHKEPNTAGSAVKAVADTGTNTGNVWYDELDIPVGGSTITSEATLNPLQIIAENITGLYSWSKSTARSGDTAAHTGAAPYNAKTGHQGSMPMEPCPAFSLQQVKQTGYCEGGKRVWYDGKTQQDTKTWSGDKATPAIPVRPCPALSLQQVQQRGYSEEGKRVWYGDSVQQCKTGRTKPTFSRIISPKTKASHPEE